MAFNRLPGATPQFPVSVGLERGLLISLVKNFSNDTDIADLETTL